MKYGNSITGSRDSDVFSEPMVCACTVYSTAVMQYKTQYTKVAAAVFNGATLGTGTSDDHILVIHSSAALGFLRHCFDHC